MPAPIPFEAPVTIATLLSSRFMMGSFLRGFVMQLADTFNNESVIDRPVFAVLGDVLVGLAVIPILCGFYAREFRNDYSLNRITFKDFVLSIGYEHFDRMILHRCFDSSPILFELFLIDGFSSREDNVCRHDRSPSLLVDYPKFPCKLLVRSPRS